MKFITRHTDYALQALCRIADAETIISAPELCKKLRMPRAFLRGILQKLNKAGLLVSIKGRGGGFKLARRASHINLLEIMEVFQQPVTLNHCFFKKRPCPRQKICRLRRRLHDIERIIIQQLKATTLESLGNSDS